MGYLGGYTEGYGSGMGVGTFDVGNTVTYTVTGLSPSTSYTVIVRAYDSGGVRGADSSPLGVTTTAAATPVSLADTGASTDAISRTIATIPKTLADTGAGVDAISHTLTGGPTTVSLADAASPTVDFISHTGTGSLTVTDTGTGADALSRTVTGGPPDLISLADYSAPAYESLSHTGGPIPPPVAAPDIEKLEWVNLGDTILLSQRQGAKGRWMPPVRLVTDKVFGQHGGRVRSVTFDVANIVVPVLVNAAVADNYRMLLREMAGSLNPLGGPGVLRSTVTWASGAVEVRELSCYYTAGMDVPEDYLDVGYASLLFQSAAAPFWTSTADTAITYSVPGTAYTWFPIGGSTWAPLALNVSDIFASCTVVNEGDVDAWPVWTIKGPASGAMTFTKLTTGRVLALNYGLSAEQTPIVIDTRPGAKTITQANVGLYGYLTAWDMWPLGAGANDIAIDIPGATNATRVTLAYRPSYLAA
jgi:hypothetical protein